jgi:hypothetical protein
MSGGENIYSEGTGLFIWRKDQFLKQDGAVRLSKLSLKIDAYIGGQARFVVKNNGKYYFSEYLMTTTGEFELSGFNNSNLPTKRWLEFNPATNNFSIPFSAPLMLTGFIPVTFDDVTEVGFWITSHRPSWSHSLAFSSFKAYAEATGNSNISVVSNTTFSIYPNPVKDYLYIDIEETPVVVKVYSGNGILLYKAENSKILDLSFLSHGFYLLQMNTSKGNIGYRFIKE